MCKTSSKVKPNTSFLAPSFSYLLCLSSPLLLSIQYHVDKEMIAKRQQGSRRSPPREVAVEQGLTAADSSKEAGGTAGGAATIGPGPTIRGSLVVVAVPPPHQRPLRLLVVDDVHSNRKVIVRLAAKFNDTVKEAVDGVDCVKKVVEAAEKGEPYDCIFMDNVMPNLTGPQAAKRLRELDIKIPIVGVTGNVLEDDVQDFIK